MESSFGSILREKRRSAGVSQRELAQQIGVDFSYISKLENDRLVPPAAETIVAICTVLNIPPEELLSAAGKIPADVQKSIGGSQVAQQFLQEAKQLGLSNDEWEQMLKNLHELRGNDP